LVSGAPLVTVVCDKVCQPLPAAQPCSVHHGVTATTLRRAVREKDGAVGMLGLAHAAAKCGEVVVAVDYKAFCSFSG